MCMDLVAEISVEISARLPRISILSFLLNKSIH